MSDKEIWIVSTKSRPLEGCSIDFDGSEFYTVESLVPAQSKDQATRPLKQALLEAGFELAEILSAAPYKSKDWADQIQFPEIKEAALKSSKTGQLVFALFISEPPDENYDDEDDDVEWTYK